jgi:hypothetical protein
VSSKYINVLIPGPFSTCRAALSSCAIESNLLAIEALETIRRAEAGEPVGARYVNQLNWIMRRLDEHEGE